MARGLSRVSWSRTHFNKNNMKTLRKHLKGVSAGLASIMLFATSAVGFSPIPNRMNAEKVASIADTYFKNCATCKYITVYNSENEVVYDGLVHDEKNIKNEKLNKLLAKSDFLMSNKITKYYIVTN